MRQNIAVGVSIVTSDPKLLEAVEILLARQHVARTAPNKSTLQVAGENGI